MGKEQEVAAENASGEPAPEQGGSTTDNSTGTQTQQADTQSQGSTTDWEARFKGLQPKYQQLKQAYETDKQAWEGERLKLMGQIAELETGLKSAQSDLEVLQEENKTWETEKADLQSQLDGMMKRIERTNLIMSEFPDLARFEAKGLIPQDKEGDELVAALTEMRTLITGSAEDVLKTLSAGSTGDSDHRTGSRAQGDDIVSIQNKLMDANLKGDAAEIARLTDLLVQKQNEIFAASGGGGD